jgi:shikimate kinase
MSPRRIVLVGFMGAGKSTIGRALARHLEWTFVDLDTRIEKRTGHTVPELFEMRGEAGFRDIEWQAAAALRTLDRHVIAAGGGAFAQRATRAELTSGAATVYLRCTLETVLARVGDGHGRPLATNRETITGLYLERETSYRLAEFTIDTDDGSPQALAVRVADLVLGKTPPGAR